MTTTTITPDTTELTIEQVLGLRVRVAEKEAETARDAVAEAAIEMAAASEFARAHRLLQGERMVEATGAAFRAAEAMYAVANCAQARAERELMALRGEAQRLPFVPATDREVKKMAQLLWHEGEADGMDADKALELAKRGEDLRARHNYAAYVAR